MVEGRVAERTEVLELALRGQGDLLSKAREARRIWEATFNSITDAIAITDVNSRIKLVSEHASEVFGRNPEELIGAACNQLMASGYACPHKESPLKQNSAEREGLSREGKRLLNIRVSRFEDAEGHTAGLVHVYRDVTEQRAMERQLMHIERMSLAGKLVSAVAHEVATPLSVFANIAEMLLLDAEPGSATAQELHKITTHARRLTEMMRGLLNLVRQAPSEFSAAGSGAVDGVSFASGFAPVVTAALPAVVNISSSRVIRSNENELAPLFNDPFFRDFFGDRFKIPRERRRGGTRSRWLRFPPTGR